MGNLKKESRFNLFSEYDFSENPWQIEGDQIVKREPAKKSELDVKEALKQGGAWAYNEGDHIYIDTGSMTLHQATIVERRDGLKYGIVCAGSPIVHEIDEADIVDVTENIFE